MTITNDLTEEEKQAHIEKARASYRAAGGRGLETDRLLEVVANLALAGAGYAALDPKGERTEADMRGEASARFSDALKAPVEMPDLTDPEIVANVMASPDFEHYAAPARPNSIQTYSYIFPEHPTLQ